MCIPTFAIPAHLRIRAQAVLKLQQLFQWFDWNQQIARYVVRFLNKLRAS